MAARRISDLRGLGPASARMLASADIESEADLRALGAAEAFARVRLVADPAASLNLLYALHAALADVDWRTLPDELKQSLKAQAGATARSDRRSRRRAP